MRIRRGLLGIGASSTLASGGLTEQDCESAGTILDVNTGFCMAPQYGTPADIAAAAQVQNVNVVKNAPPVYVSSFVPNPNDPAAYSTQSYAVNNTAASVASEVNDQNGRIYALYQNEVSNWVANGSQGPAPAPPQYVDFNSIWPQEGLGPVPSSISVAPAGTPIPMSGYAPSSTVSGGGLYSSPLAPVSPVPSVTPPTMQIPGNLILLAQPQPLTPAPGQAAPSQTVPVSNPAPQSPQTSGLLSQAQSFLTSNESIGGFSVPGWALAGGAVLLVLLFMRHK